ncbi:MAG: DUF402 domain-containing protein [Thermofilum sp.]|nr:DUF402 domain-containing protein [Thermofilum sp.]
MLDDAGFSFADVSMEILSRFSSLKKSGEVLVTIKDQDDKSGLIILGDDEILKMIIFLLRGIVPGLIVSYIPVGPYSTYVVRLVERVDHDIWLAEYEPGKFGTVKLRNNHSEGDFLLAHVTRASLESPMFKEGAAFVGRYVRLVQFEKHNTSEHIRNEELKLQLLTLAMSEAPQGWGVHFRSSSRNANILDIGKEIRELSEKAANFLKEAKLQSIGLLVQGESLALVELPPDTSRKFDALRDRYFPTLPYHHLLKSLGMEDLNSKIDFAESLIKSGRCFIKERAFEVLLEEFTKLNGGRVSVFHKKLTGHGHVWSAYAEVQDSFYIKLKRQSSSRGLYDGFRNVRREEGDQILSYSWLFGRAVIHFYYSVTGALKGMYVNINTPLFFTSQPPSIRYVDLGIDVTYSPEEGVQVTDREEYESLVDQKILNRETVRQYNEFVESIASLLGKKDIKELVREVRRLQASIFRTEVDTLV